MAAVILSKNTQFDPYKSYDRSSLHCSSLKRFHAWPFFLCPLLQILRAMMIPAHTVCSPCLRKEGGIQVERNIYLCSVAVFVGDRHCMLVVRFVSGAAQTPQSLFLRFLGPWYGRGRTKFTFECLFCVCACVIWVATHSITFVFRHIRYVHSKRSQRRRTFSLSLSRHNQDGHPVTGDVCSAIYFHAAFQQTFGRWSVSAPVSSFLRQFHSCQFL